MHPRQHREDADDTFPIRVEDVVSANFNLRRNDSRIKRTDSTGNTTREPRATDPRL